MSVDIIDHADRVPAKVDTGADSSSIWVSDIHVGSDNILRFKLFGPGSSFYTGNVIECKEYNVALVRGATGHQQIRYRAQFSVRIKNRRIRVNFNLSDRSRNKFAMLIGRRSLSGKFIVDVRDIEYADAVSPENKTLNDELSINPYKFHKDHYENQIG